ncbi:hypothetical protein Slala05_46120 [Streptomyces lavendulae subsp. lavendulae]|nr:hypothetical protein Slala05_46120 [Streptomyces lavendulae subsp. lavendulae]
MKGPVPERELRDRPLRVVLPRAGSVLQGGLGHRERAVRSDDLAVRQQLTGVLEEKDPVAQQAPALFRVVGHRARGLPVGGL